MTFSTKRSLRSALLSFAAAFALPVWAATINVPADQKTIQAGIDAANPGDTVLVAPGTYFENIDFKGKAITVTSSAGAASTIIDGGSKPGVATVVFVTGETSSSVISSFTIRGGGDTIFAGKSDGGIYVNGASPMIENNTVTANACHNIDVEFGAATILNNEVSGVVQGNSQVESYCTFGSGVHLQGTSYSNGAVSSVVGNTIENNLTGSAVNLWAAQNVLIMNNIIRNNISSDPGSAFTSANSGGTALVQNLIYDNTSTCGGAIGFMDSGYAFLSILIANNTIVDNVTPDAGGGSECTPIAQIYPDPYSYGASSPSALIMNNIISGSTSYPAVNCSQFDQPSETIQPKFENNILYNAGGPFFGSHCVDVTSKYNNIVDLAQFVSPSTGDYHLKSTSPAIDSGDNSILQTFMNLTGQSLTADFDGKPRLQNVNGNACTIDMGAYEYPGTQNQCASTAETLQSSLNPSLFGQTVTFTAQLSSSNGTLTGDVEFSDGDTVLGTVAVSDTGSAALSTSTLTIGSHNIKAIYQSSGSLSAATATLTQVINGYATTTSLTSSLNPANTGQPITFTAAVTSANGTPTGTITFSDGTAALGTATLVNGIATFNTGTLAVGTHAIAAAYNPTGTVFNASTATLSQVVNGIATSTSLTVNPTTAVYGSQIMMSSSVTAAGVPVVVLGGGITFMDGTNALCEGETVAGTPTLFCNYSYLSVGTHTITAAYSGDATHNASTSSPVTVTITAAATALVLSAAPNPATTIQTITLTAKLAAGTGGSTTASSINFLANGNVIGSSITSGQGTAVLTTNLPAGTHTLTAVFAGTTNLSGSTSAPVNEVVNLSATSTAISAQPNPGFQGGNETFTASVTAQSSSGGTSSIPNGIITFLDSGTLLGTTNLDAQGQAVFSIVSLAAGDHVITAIYSGAPNFLPSSSASYSLNILPRDFILTSDPTITIQTEHHKNLNLSLDSIGDFTDTIALSCSPMPVDAYCTFPSNGTLLPAGSTLPTTLRIDTDAAYNYLSSSDPSLQTPTHPRLRAGISFALLLPITLLAAVRRRRTLRRALGLFASLSVFLIVIAFTGCSGHYPAHTPPGTYTFTVTGQGVSTQITHTATVTLIVTP